jgi:biopolymer transport protein ExbD
VAIHSLPSAGEEVGDDIVAEINITPLTDIFLVLLIIFMVTTSVISTQGKEVDLPSSAVASATPNGVNVTVTADGLIQVNDDIVKSDALPAALKAALDKSREKLVILRGDRKVLLGEAVNILDVAQQAGATGIALATKPPPRGEQR